MPTSLPPRSPPKTEHPAIVLTWIIGALTVSVLTIGLARQSGTPYELVSDAGLPDPSQQTPYQQMFR